MKIRQGYVSNSSSTSFYILGAKIELPNCRECEKRCDVVKAIAEKEFPEYDYEFADALQTEISDNREPQMDVYCNGEGGNPELFVGEDISSLNEDKTIKQLKSEIREQVLQKIGNMSECSYVKVFIDFYDEYWTDY